MKALKVVLFFSAIFAAGCLSAQTHVLKFQPLKFNASGIAIRFSGTMKNNTPADVVLFSPETHAAELIDPVVHYPAFFCRMELRSVDQLGIWIKIHAGDYDTYSRSNSTH